VINNAASVGGTPGTVETVSDTDVLRDFEEKVVGYLRTAQAAVPYLKQAGWGRVINISGGAGRAPGTADTSWRCCVLRSPSACTAKPSASTAATAPTCTIEGA
jgi:NAD(P)-dependent dehydrogenase (short-subunit alcohol dehydrogenase family)